SMATVITCSCSAWDRVADSPVEPHGTIPCTPELICHSISSRKAASSTAPSRNGVTIADNAPVNITNPPVAASDRFLPRLQVAAWDLEVYQNPHPALSHNKMWERDKE